MKGFQLVSMGSQTIFPLFVLEPICDIQDIGHGPNGQRIDAFDQLICDKDLNEDKVIILRSGKKRFHKIIPKN